VGSSLSRFADFFRTEGAYISSWPIQNGNRPRGIGKAKLSNKPSISIHKVRSVLYAAAKLLGDLSAIQNGHVWERGERRLVGKLLGRMLGKLFR